MRSRKSLTRGVENSNVLNGCATGNVRDESEMCRCYIVTVSIGMLKHHSDE